MKAARFYEPNKPLRVEEVNRPTPGPGEALVRVRAAGVCHTELHFQDGILTPAHSPITLGHEVAGEIEAINGQTDLAVGDRVVANYLTPCGKCAICETRQTHLCPSPKRFLAFVHDGGFAEYVLVPTESLIRLPDSISYESGATLACSATTALHAMRRIGRVKQGEAVVVYGLGGIGLLMVQLGRHLGLRTIGISRTVAKLEQALALGAEAVVDGTSSDLVERVRALTDGRGADAVFELVGTGESMEKSLVMLARGGRLVLVGYSTDLLSVHPLTFLVPEQEIRTSVGNTHQELVEVVDLASQGVIEPQIGRTLPLEEANDALDSLRAGEILGRAVLIPSP